MYAIASVSYHLHSACPRATEWNAIGVLPARDRRRPCAFRLWNALIYRIVIGLLSSRCMQWRVTPETAICEELVVMLRLATRASRWLGAGAGSDGGCGIDRGHGGGGVRTELGARGVVGGAIDSSSILSAMAIRRSAQVGTECRQPSPLHKGGGTKPHNYT